MVRHPVGNRLCGVCEKPLYNTVRIYCPDCQIECMVRAHLACDCGGRTHGSRTEERRDIASEYVPTPEEIAATTAVLRANWSELEHYQRAGLNPPEACVATLKHPTRLARRGYEV